MSLYHSLTVKEVIRETPDAVCIRFEIPTELIDTFQYKPGQYLTFRFEVNGQNVNRSYSVCSNPFESEPLSIGVKEVPGGKVSPIMNRKLKAGDQVLAMEPMGNFIANINPNNNKHYILFGGGSGITPLYSILKSALQEEPNSQVTLFYGNRNGDSIIFQNGLNELKKTFGNRLKIIHVFNEPKKKKGLFKSKSLETIEHIEGLMTRDLNLRLLKENTNLNFTNAEFYICGPTPMMKEVQKALADLAIPKDKVNVEYFTEKADEDKESASVGSGSEAGFSGTATINVQVEGKEFSFSMTEDDNILNAALENNVDPPFACMVGACTSCKAKVIEGKVHMDDSDALLPAEIEEGYILTCQSHPKTSIVKVNYDA